MRPLDPVPDPSTAHHSTYILGDLIKPPACDLQRIILHDYALLLGCFVTYDCAQVRHTNHEERGRRYVRRPHNTERFELTRSPPASCSQQRDVPRAAG